MFAKCPDDDERDSPRPSDRHQQQHCRDKGTGRADPQDLPVGEPAQYGKERYEQHAWRLAQELQHATVEAVDIVGLDEKVVERRAEAPDADAPHENAREESARPGSRAADGLI